MNHAWGVFDLVLSDHSSLSPVINKNVSVGAPGPTLPKWKWCVAKYQVLLMVSKKLKRFQNKSGHTQYVTWVQDNEACYKLHEINVTLFKRDFDIKKFYKGYMQQNFHHFAWRYHRFAVHNRCHSCCSWVHTYVVYGCFVLWLYEIALRPNRIAMSYWLYFFRWF